MSKITPGYGTTRPEPIKVSTEGDKMVYTKGLVKDCCLDVANLDVKWEKTDPKLDKPDLETKTCRTCGCRHRRWMLQPVDVWPTSKAKTMQLLSPEPERTK